MDREKAITEIQARRVYRSVFVLFEELPDEKKHTLASQMERIIYEADPVSSMMARVLMEDWKIRRLPVKLPVNFDPYTKADDDPGYLVCEAGGYLSFPLPDDKKEIIGYTFLKSIMNWLESRETLESCHALKEVRMKKIDGQWVVQNERLVEGDELSRTLATAYLSVGQEPVEPEPLDDRGYEPPTFTPNLEMNYYDMLAFLKEHEKSLDGLAHRIFDILIREQQIRTIKTYWDRKQHRDLSNFRFAVPFPRALATLRGWHELAPAERYGVLKHLAGKLRTFIPSDALKDIEAQGFKSEHFRKYMPAMRFWAQTNGMVHGSGLEFFVDLYWDELHDGETQGPVHVTTEAEILEMGERVIDEVVGAPIIRIERWKLEYFWRLMKKNQAQFLENPSPKLQKLCEHMASRMPDPTKVITKTANGFTTFWLKDPTDWSTLGTLLALGGTEIDPKNLHARTPTFQVAMLRAIAGGADVKSARDMAWKSYRAALRDARPRPIHISSFNGRMFIGTRNGMKVSIAPNILKNLPVTLDDPAKRAIQQAAVVVESGIRLDLLSLIGKGVS